MKELIAIKVNSMRETQIFMEIGPRNFNFQRPTCPWNTAPNNGGIPNPMVNNNNVNQVNNVDLSVVRLNTWCRIHSTMSHGESDCLEFQVALNIFQQEIQNMEMTPNEEPSSPPNNSNPTLVSKMCDRDEVNMSSPHHKKKYTQRSNSMKKKFMLCWNNHHKVSAIITSEGGITHLR